MSNVHLIAAVGLSGQIGLDGKIPWHGDERFAYQTRADLKEFSRLTEGGILIMGATTAAQMPMMRGLDPSKLLTMDLNGGRSLVVWTRRLGEDPHDLLKALSHEGRNIWICGGQTVYELFIPYVDWHHISVIPYEGPADRFLPPIIPGWKLKELYR